MPFRVQEFRDLIRLLEERPEWRAELRRLLLTDALLALPDLVRELVEAQRRSEERLSRLAEAQQRTEARVGRLEEAVAGLAEAQQQTEARVGRLEEAVAALAEAQQQTEARVGRVEEAVAALAEAQSRTERQVTELTVALHSLTDTVHTLTIDVGELKGDSLDRRYRERVGAYFARLVRRARLLSDDELAAMLEEAVSRRQLSEEEAEEISSADLVVEVSWGVGPHDVQRAAQRSALLARAGVLAMPTVAGKTVTEEAADLAASLQVWQVTDGQVVPPE